MRISDWSSDVCSSDLARSARADSIRDRLAAGSFESFDDIEHAVAHASAQVHGYALWSIKRFKRFEVTRRQIDHMDVVAHARAIRRGVVVAPDVENFPPTHGHLGHLGHAVVGRDLWVFAGPQIGRAAWREGEGESG